MLRRIARLIFRVIPLWSGRLVVYAGFGALVAAGGLILALRYAILPNIEAYRDDFEAVLAQATGQRVSIGEIKADWQGWRPQFSLGKVVLYDHAGRPALELKRIDNSLSWLSLLVLEPRFYSLHVHQPELLVRRSADGAITVAGIEIRKGDHDSGLADWLLRQREVVIIDASVSWIDETRRAPELKLSGVSIKMENDYHRHRFGLRARAPAELAGAIDIRGDFTGSSLKKLAQWEGQVFAQFDDVDLTPWKQWVDLPVEIATGRGAVRTWVDIAGARVTGANADVRLSDVKMRLGADLEELDLAHLSGHLGWRDWRSGIEVFAQRLEGLAVGGREFASKEFNLRRTFAQPGKPAHGEFSASMLDLGALAELARHLPFDPATREELRRFAPRGKVYDLGAKWTGEWPPPQYELKARFEQLSVDAVGKLPGIAGVTGSVDATDKRGTMKLASRNVGVALPHVFTEALAFAELSGQVNWTAAAGRYDVRLSDVKFVNEDAAGTLQGSYRSAPDGPGAIDLTGALSRADARRVAKYMPLVIGKPTREWLQTAVISGRSNDVKFRIKGDLARFPFVENGKDIFEVTAKARDGVVQYADGWPRLENVSADLSFTGTRMEIKSTSARILGAQLTRVQAVIPDVSHVSEILEINGDAEGATAEFLRFIAESPVGAMIDRFTDDMEAQGSGRLSLRLILPLRKLKESRVAGSYQLRANRLQVDPDLPPLERVEGRIDFTEAAVRGQGISAQIFGGPAVVDLTTQDGAVAVAASGRANIDALKKGYDHPLLQHLSGSADWRSSVKVRAKLADFTVESTLQGVTSSLPAPLAKAAAERFPVRFERRLSGSQQDQVDVSLGQVATAQIQRRREGGRSTVERAAIGLGASPPSAEGPGIWVRGSLSALDLDRWREVTADWPNAGPAAPPLAALDLKLSTLDVFARRFTHVSIDARPKAGEWRARVSAKELVGEIGWQSQGKGRIEARLQRLDLPMAQDRVSPSQAPDTSASAEYPALDIVVDDFRHNARAWGRLELKALPDGRNWQIERLQLRSPDGTLTADGTWQWQARVPRTEVNYRLEVADIGKFLARMGYPEGVKGGIATLSGKLAWTGAPQDLDMPSLSGQIAIEASRGQFIKLEPGIGKLLSIFNLQALPRRVALDFKDIFSDGFAFDTISGVAKVQRGIATTDGLRIVGSSATVAMSGDVDLARETQNLRVRVTPVIGDSVATVTALLGGPVAGIGVFLAQRLLKDPLGQLIAYDYAVTGTWSDPSVTKIPFGGAG